MAMKTGKAVKKGFFEVSAPFTSARIALYASEIAELDGKVVSLDLTRSLRGKSFVMEIKIRVDGDKLVGEPVALELAGSYIRRMMRTGTDYVEDSFEAECKDGKARVKPFMITRNKVSRAIRKDLRITAREFLQGYARTRNAREIFSDLMANKIQRELSFKLKKIYPLALCEIRVFELLGKQSGVKPVEKKEAKQEAVKTEASETEEKKEKRIKKEEKSEEKAVEK